MIKIYMLILLLVFNVTLLYPNAIAVNHDNLLFTPEIVEIKPMILSDGNEEKPAGRVFDIGIYVKNTGERPKKIALGKTDAIKFHSGVPILSIHISAPKDSRGNALKPPEVDLRIVNLCQGEKSLLCYCRVHVENSQKTLKFSYTLDAALAEYFNVWHGVVNIAIPLPH